MTQQTKETKNCIYQLRAKLNKAQTGKQSAKRGINENKTNKYVERKGKKEEEERIDAKLNRGR